MRIFLQNEKKYVKLAFNEELKIYFMTNNKLNINYTRFARKEDKEKENYATTPKLGQIFLTKNLK